MRPPVRFPLTLSRGLLGAGITISSSLFLTCTPHHPSLQAAASTASLLVPVA